jgi:hypothetical protein
MPGKVTPAAPAATAAPVGTGQQGERAANPWCLLAPGQAAHRAAYSRIGIRNNFRSFETSKG